MLGKEGMDIVQVPQNSTAPQDATLCEDQKRDSEGSFKFEDPTEVTAGETFFQPLGVTPTTKVLPKAVRGSNGSECVHTWFMASDGS